MSVLVDLQAGKCDFDHCVTSNLYNTSTTLIACPFVYFVYRRFNYYSYGSLCYQHTESLEEFALTVLTLIPKRKTSIKH